MTFREPKPQVSTLLSGADVVAFDWDMTVVDSHGKLLQNQAIAAEFDNPLSLDAVRLHWNESTSFPDLMSRLTNGADMESVMEVVRRDYHNLAFAKQAFEFAVPAILAIKRAGYQTALVSSVQRELLQEDAENLQLDLDVLFEFIQAQDDYEHKKPDGRVFTPLIQHFGIVASRLLYVGDEMKDMRAINAAGGRFIGVETGMSTAAEFDAAGAVHVPTLKEVRNYGTI